MLSSIFMVCMILIFLNIILGEVSLHYQVITWLHNLRYYGICLDKSYTLFLKLIHIHTLLDSDHFNHQNINIVY